MSKKHFILGLTAAAAVAGLWFFLTLDRSASRLFDGTTSIVFTDGFPSDRRIYAAFHDPAAATNNVVPIYDRPDAPVLTLSVSNPAVVARFLSTLNLRPKDRCMCTHDLDAVFQTPDGPVRVSFCNHCFNISNGQTNRAKSKWTHYRMPSGFYTAFRTLVDQEIYPQK